jgi:uncharacterized membrane protein YbaN (DUF454 family)
VKASANRNPFINFLLILGGSISVLLGIIGIFVPILPTTPFLLLAAACYIRSSDKFYSWLINNRWLGKYIQNYREKKGMKLSSKVLSISMLSVSILYAVVYATDNLILRIVLLLIAVSVTYHLISIKTLQGDDD